MVRYVYINKVTGEEREEDRRIADRDQMPDNTGDWGRRLEAPAFTSASYLDGQKRPKSEGFDQIKTAARLQQAKADATDFFEKRAIDKEIKKVEKSK